MKKRYLYMFFVLLLFLLSSNIVFADVVEEFPICENPEILKVIFFGSIIVDIVKIIIPIGLIVMAMIDFSKGVTSNNEGDNKKNLSRLIKRFVYAILIFAVPWIVKIVIINLGNLTKDVNYTDCLKNATAERIEELQPIYDAWLAEQEKQNGGDSGSSSDDVNFSDEAKVRIKYSDDIVDNMAAFIGSEANAFEEGFEAQLITGAVFMNNMYFSCGRTPFVTSPEQITKKTMCDTFSYGGMYSEKKCKYTLDSIGFNSEQKKRLTVAAKLVLSGIFTIPSNINCQGIIPNWINKNGEQIGLEWGSLAVKKGCTIDKYHEDSCSQTYAYSKYCTVEGGISSKDIYGYTVSKNFSDYKVIADTLYQKYVVEGKEIF